MQPQRGRQHFEQIDRCRVGTDHLVKLCADQARDLGADPARQVDPVRCIPGADQAFAPLVLDHVFDALARGAWQRTERIPIEIDHALRQREFLAMRCERILRIQSDAFIARHLGSSSRSTARTGLASQPAIFNGSAISS